MRFVPHDEEEKKEMLKAIGIGAIKELFKDIPRGLLLKGELEIGHGLDEIELMGHIEGLAGKNRNAKQLHLFLGAGCYNHFIPAAVPALVGRSEFYTAYTPYQAEISQGMLQAIYEWQSHISMLTGMDLANASMYDGASATAEAMLMAKNFTKRKKVLFAEGLNPEYRAVVETYAKANGIELKEIGLDGAECAVDGGTACLIVQQPNFFGCIEELNGIAEKMHRKGALLVVAVAEAMSLGHVEKPGSYGADIVAMEAQSFGNPMCFGGPHAGVIACRQELMRHIPGRLVGRAVDSGGKDGFILTLQAREQHIRREKASSNICSNQALCALAATVYLGIVGEKGLKGIAKQNHENAEYLKVKLLEQGFEMAFEKPFFNEFVVKKENVEGLQEKLLEKGFVLGHAIEGKKGWLLVAATEMNSKEEIDELAEALEEIG